MVDRLVDVAESFLDAAAAAAKDRRWADVVVHAEDALMIDADSTEARSLLQLALQYVDLADVRTGRRQLTILFADLVGSTPLSVDQDPEDYTHLVLTYHRACRRAIQRYRGHIIGEQGDGVVAAFGHPIAGEDDSHRAVAAALDIVELVAEASEQLQGELRHRLGVRVGIHTGLVVIDDRGQPYGDTMNIASRVQDRAALNSVVMSTSTAVLTRESVASRSLGSFELKGVSSPVELFEVTGMPARPMMLAADRIVPLVARDVEFALLNAAWNAAQLKAGTVSVVVGEAGIGKSRLVEELRRRVEADGHPTIVMRSSSLDSSAALHPVLSGLRHRLQIGRSISGVDELEILSGTLRDAGLMSERHLAILASLFGLDDAAVPLPTLAPAELRNARLNLLVDLLVAVGAQTPHLFVLEDLHWADTTTVELLHRVVDAGLPQGVALVVTARHAADTIRLAGGVTVTLQALSMAESAELARALSPVSLDESRLDHIAQRSDGIPLYIEQLALAGTVTDEPVPASLTDLLQSRVDATGPSKPMAQFGSVFGRDFDPDVLDDALAHLAKFAPSDPAAAQIGQVNHHLEHLVDAGLIEAVTDGSMRFHHALVRDAAYDSQLLTERPKRHEAAAVALERAGAGTDPSLSARIANHFEIAGRLTEAADHWMSGADRAARTGDVDQALNQLVRADELIERMDGATQSLELEVCMRRATLLAQSQGFAADGVSDLYVRCLELCDEMAADTGSQAQQARALLGLWTYRFNSGDLDGSSEILERLEPLVPAGEFPGLRPVINATRGVEMAYRGRLAEARDLIDRAEAAEPSDQVDLASWPLPNDCLSAGLAVRGLVEACMGDAEASRRTMASALERCASLPFPFGPYSEAFVCGYMTWASQLTGDLERAGDSARSAIEVAQRHGFAEWILVGSIHESVVRLFGDDPASVVAPLGSMVDMYRLSGARLGLPSFDGAVATAHLMTGDLDRAASLAADAVAAAIETGQLLLVPDLHRLEGIVQATLGSEREATDSLREGRSIAAAQCNDVAMRAIDDMAQMLGLQLEPTS